MMKERWNEAHEFGTVAACRRLRMACWSTSDFGARVPLGLWGSGVWSASKGMDSVPRSSSPALDKSFALVSCSSRPLPSHPPFLFCPTDGDQEDSPRLPRGSRLTHAELEALERGVRGLHQRYRAAVRPITKGCQPTRQELKELRWHAAAVSARCLVMCMDRVPEVRRKGERGRGGA